MVNFNDAATVTTPSSKILQILALEKRENLLLAVEFYYKNKFTDQDKGTELGVLKSNSWLLYYELQALLQRKRNPEQINELKKNMNSETVEEVFKAVDELNLFMDEVHFTKIDNKKIYDSTNTELENELNEL